ncbi:MarR family winged helix-turn-helix transcriptional regulator [Cupriavidus pauculus]|uniref:MarR family transcriptional regulator n=1 Tax=Cupriavidus pauculus TaxID=82633 RepID=A0A2N5C5L6_9BURK|nr:MarR family transcriptional regulator [Cupriavidus pauculus]PLP97487.1 MarR family transcriptional regulator [Cupriavidus pauculus]
MSIHSPDVRTLPVHIDSFHPDHFDISSSLAYLLARAKNSLFQSIEQEVGSLHLTHTQASCLMMLAYGGDTTTASDIARNLNTDAGSVTRLLNRMEKRGLVVRNRRDIDRRVVDLSLTEKGHAMAKMLPKIFSDVLRKHFNGFRADEISTFRRMLLFVAAECKTEEIAAEE